ncbi:Putative Polyprotein, partial [Phytophthora palmivora]
MEVDAVEASQRQQWSPSRRGRSSRDNRPMVCFRCRKSGHRAAVCRAPAPVITYAQIDIGLIDDVVGHGRRLQNVENTTHVTLTQTQKGLEAVLRHVQPGSNNQLECDSRLIIVSLLVAGARRPLRALLDSGATNNFFRASCLSVLPDSVRVRNGPGEVEIKLADGKTRRVARREVSLPYTFDGFHSNDDFLVIEMNYAFDCILGIPWLARYQPQIDWLARSVKRPHGFDVSEVFTHLVVAPRDWPHVTVVDALLTGDDDEGRAREDARERQASAHPRSSRLKNVAVEQRLPHDIEAVEQWLPRTTEAVEQRLDEIIANQTDRTTEAVEQRLLHAIEAVVQRFPHDNEAVEQRLPHDDAAGGQQLPPRATGAVEDELSRLEEGVSSSSESDTSVSSSGSRRT